MRNRILTSLEHRAEPVTNGQLIEAFGLTDAKDKSRLYNAMSSLKRNGAVVQDDSYRYTLVRGNGHAAN
jgi:DNA-binding IclR family transcriptional regulator